jgi:hypothetical protein
MLPVRSALLQLRDRVRLRRPITDRRFVGHPMLIGHLSPEDKNAAEVYRLTPSPRRGGVVKFRDERSTAFSAAS